MQKYCVQGPTSQGLDLAGFLAKVRFEAPVDSDGFTRRFVSGLHAWIWLIQARKGVWNIVHASSSP